MAIRMTGLNSGLDTDTIVQALVSAQSLKVTKVENKLTKSEWTSEIWKDLNTKLYSLFNKQVSKLRTKGNYNLKKVSSSDESICTATASTSAPKGSHTLEVTQLATSQTVTSGKIKATSDQIKLKDLKMVTGTVIEINNAGKTSKFEVKDSSTIADYVKALKDAGLNANFDKKQQRLFISNSESGVAKSFSIKTVDSDSSGKQKTLKDSLLAEIDALVKEDGSPDTVAQDAAKAEMDAHLGDLEALSSADLTKIDTWLSMEDTTVQEIADAKAIIAGKSYTEEEISDLEALLGKEENGEPLDSTEQANLDAYKEYKEAEKYLEDNKTLVEAYEFEENNTDLVMAYEYLSTLDTDFSSNLKSYVSAKEYEVATGGEDQLTHIGLMSFDKNTSENPVGAPDGFSLIQGKDAEIILDGAKLTDSSNQFTVNGLTLDLKNAQPGKTISLTTTNDTSAVYDMVKDFVKEYNNVMKEMNTYYKAASAKGYDPLTDEQKEAMSDEEVEKWEKKIKDSLLRNDSTLASLMNAMRGSLIGAVKVDGKSYSLANLGIHTSSDYTEGGLLHIYGDEEDENYSTETNKLKEMIENDPETVMNALSQIGQNLYDTLNQKMGRTSLSSALTFYNDKKLKSEQDDYKKKIKQLQEKLTDLEDRYYDKFTAMEKAMAKLNSQTNALSSLMGGGQ